MCETFNVPCCASRSEPMSLKLSLLLIQFSSWLLFAAFWLLLLLPQQEDVNPPVAFLIAVVRCCCIVGCCCMVLLCCCMTFVSSSTISPLSCLSGVGPVTGKLLLVRCPFNNFTQLSPQKCSMFRVALPPPQRSSAWRCGLPPASGQVAYMGGAIC